MKLNTTRMITVILLITFAFTLPIWAQDQSVSIMINDQRGILFCM